ncbi:MAG: hypothetical protein J5I93_09830 [Pirellulaceae bacterium]|nr:hypothetical protein [Pirellulaceae bacterium]
MAPQLIVEMTADEAKVFSAQQKLIAQQEKMITKYRELAQAGKQQSDSAERAGDEGDKAFGAGAQSKLAAFKGILAGVSAVAAGLAPAFAASAAELSKNFEALRGAEGGLAQLAQLATTPQEFQSLQREARQLYAAGAAPDLGSAATQLFGLISAGLQERDRKFMARMAATQFVPDVGKLATSINTLQTTMRDAAGSATNIMNAGIAASGDAPSEVPQLLAGASRAAGVAGRLGFGLEEILAATAFTSSATGTAEMGGTQVRALLTAIGMNADQFGGMNLANVVREIQGRQLDQKGLQKLLGTDEAIAGFTTLATNLDGIITLQREILDAQRTNVVGQRVGFIEQDTMLRNLRGSRQAEARSVVGDEARAAERALFDAMVAGTVARHRERGRLEIFQGANLAAAEIVRMTGLERPVMEGTRFLSRLRGTPQHRELSRELRQIDAMRDASRMMQPDGAGASEAAKMQLEAARLQLEASRQRTVAAPPIPQANPARAEQAQQTEIGK